MITEDLLAFDGAALLLVELGRKMEPAIPHLVRDNE
jgi:hypothetical protein